MERIKKNLKGLLSLISLNEMRILPAHLAFLWFYPSYLL